MNRYVCGFAYSSDRSMVNLIIKKHPDWQAGKCNGVGGHINHEESPIDAMVREWQEETGMVTHRGRWELCFTLSDKKREAFEVVFFRSFSDHTQSNGVTDERVVSVHVASVAFPVVPNLKWIIPLLASPDILFPLTIYDSYFREEDHA